MSGNRRRPQVRREHGRGVAARHLEEHLLGDTTPARDWDSELELPPMPPKPRRPRTVPARKMARNWTAEQLLERYGVTELARMSGIGRTTLKDWRAGRRDPGHARAGTQARVQAAAAEANRRIYAEYLRDREQQHQQAVRDWERAKVDAVAQRAAAAQAELAELLNRLGGPDGMAQAAGVSVRQVQRWLSGRAEPTPASLGKLRLADGRWRIEQAQHIRLAHNEEEAEEYGVAVGEAIGDLYIHAEGDVSMYGGEGSPEYNYHRHMGIADVGPDGTHPIPPDVAAAMIDQIALGEREAALDILQEHMSTGYAMADGYNPDGSLGWHLGNLDEFYFRQTGYLPPEPGEGMAVA